MPGKKRGSKSAKVGAKPRSGSSRSKSPSGKKRSKSARAAPKSRLTSAASVRERDPDILDPPAMENLYYIAHGAVDALELRGFCWDEAPKGKKGKKGKKKKK